MEAMEGTFLASVLRSFKHNGPWLNFKPVFKPHPTWLRTVWEFVLK